MDCAAREIIEITPAGRDCVTVNGELYLAVEDVICLVPVVSMSGRSHPERHFLFEERLVSASLARFTKHRKRHAQDIKRLTCASLDNSCSHRFASFGGQDIPIDDVLRRSPSLWLVGEHETEVRFHPVREVSAS